MPYPCQWRGHTLLSPYGRAFWFGYHFYLNTPDWKPRQPSRNLIVYRSSKHLRAFWAGYDIARQAYMSGAATRNTQTLRIATWHQEDYAP